MRFLTGVLLCFVLIGSSGLTQPNAESYYRKGMVNLKQKDYIKAIGNFTNAISLNPKFGDAYYNRAKAKKRLADKMGFANNELCYDLTNALRHGNAKAIGMLEANCIGECFSPETAFKEPGIVLCANFSSNVLDELPAKTPKLKNIAKLNAFDNNITKISPRLGKLNTLVKLNMSSNKLKSIGDPIGNLKYLTELNLNKNHIRSMSSEIGKLQHLEALYMRKNKLKELPKSIATLSSLKELDLSFNQLQSIPLQIANLKNLETLNLVGNEGISNKERKKIKSLLPNTKVYFE